MPIDASARVTQRVGEVTKCKRQFHPQLLEIPHNRRSRTHDVANEGTKRKRKLSINIDKPTKQGRGRPPQSKEQNSLGNPPLIPGAQSFVPSTTKQSQSCLAPEVRLASQER